MLNLKSKIIIICGPTASGKTALALKLAGDEPTAIISADSRQVYEGLDILTGKDIPEGAKKLSSSLLFHHRPVVYYEIDNLRFWGFDLLKSDESFNAAEFVTLTNQIIIQEINGDRGVIVVGGTGFYLKALTQPEMLAHVSPSEELRQELSLLSTEDLQQRLWEIEPQKFLSLNDSDIKNPRRLTRAIEIFSSPFVPIRPSGPISPISFRWLGLRPSLPETKRKILARVNSRLSAGAVAELKALLIKYPNRFLPIYTSLGVAQILQFLDGEITSDQLRELWVIAEVNYAKRQVTWFKKQPQIIWYK